MNPKASTFAYLLAAGLTLGLLAGCNRRAAPAGAHFGEPFSDAPRVGIAALLATPDAFHRQSVRVAGTIERQCPASGCWFFLREPDGGPSLKIELGDYLPKLPQNVGNRAEVEGELIRKGERYEFIGTRVTFTPGARP